jgi:hypothetical protein
MVLRGRRCPAVWVIWCAQWRRRGVLLRVVWPVLGKRRGRELGPAVHLGAVIVLAVEAAAALLVPSAAQAAAHAPTETAPETLHTTASTLAALVALVVAIVVAAVAQGVARRRALALGPASAAVVPQLALASRVA